MMRRLIPSSDKGLAALFNGMDAVVSQFRQEAPQPVESGIIRVASIDTVLAIRSNLGNGSQAKVYSAVLRSSGKEVAVKVESKRMTEKQKIDFKVRVKCGTEA